MAQDTRMPQPGYIAPRIEALSVNAGQFSLAAQRGNWVVAYFFPRADSSGCADEAKDFQAHKAVLDEVNAVVVGISADKADVQRRFTDKHEITFPVIADSSKVIIGSYGTRAVLGGGASRSTFLIDPNGKIARVWPKVKVEGHAGDVVLAIRSLAAGASEKK